MNRSAGKAPGHLDKKVRRDDVVGPGRPGPKRLARNAPDDGHLLGGRVAAGVRLVRNLRPDRNPKHLHGPSKSSC